MRLRPRPVSMFCAGSGVERARRVLVVLHEDEVPELEEALVLAARAGRPALPKSRPRSR